MASRADRQMLIAERQAAIQDRRTTIMAAGQKTRAMMAESQIRSQQLQRKMEPLKLELQTAMADASVKFQEAGLKMRGTELGISIAGLYQRQQEHIDDHGLRLRNQALAEDSEAWRQDFSERGMGMQEWDLTTKHNFEKARIQQSGAMVAGQTKLMGLDAIEGQVRFSKMVKDMTSEEINVALGFQTRHAETVANELSNLSDYQTGQAELVQQKSQIADSITGNFIAADPDNEEFFGVTTFGKFMLNSLSPKGDKGKARGAQNISSMMKMISDKASAEMQSAEGKAILDNPGSSPDQFSTFLESAGEEVAVEFYISAAKIKGGPVAMEAAHKLEDAQILMENFPKDIESKVAYNEARAEFLGLVKMKKNPMEGIEFLSNVPPGASTDPSSGEAAIGFFSKHIVRQNNGALVEMVKANGQYATYGNMAVSSRQSISAANAMFNASMDQLAAGGDPMDIGTRVETMMKDFESKGYFEPEPGIGMPEVTSPNMFFPNFGKVRKQR